MKNNKGFTIIELAVSFCLVAAVSITLLQLVLSLKEVYLSGDVKTTLLNKQGIMTKKIYDDLNTYTLTNLESCGVSCLSFTFAEKEDVINLLVDPGNNTLTYGDYTIKLDNSSYFGKLEFEIDESNAIPNTINSIFKIDIPIISKLLDEDIGIHIIKAYDYALTLTIDILSLDSLTNNDVIATINGVDIHKDDVLLYKENGILKNIFFRIYHQEANNYFNEEYNNFLKNSNPATFSILGSLDIFKQKINIDKIIGSETEYINSQSITDREKKKQISSLNENYQNGYYSLLLNYNNNSIESGNYSWWIQTNNFAKKEPLSGFTIGHSSENYDTSYIFGNISNGLSYNNTSSSWANIYGTNYNLGVKNGNIVSSSGNATSIDLYVEAREFLCKYSFSDLLDGSDDLKTYLYSDGYQCK